MTDLPAMDLSQTLLTCSPFQETWHSQVKAVRMPLPGFRGEALVLLGGESSHKALVGGRALGGEFMAKIPRVVACSVAPGIGHEDRLQVCMLWSDHSHQITRSQDTKSILLVFKQKGSQ